MYKMDILITEKNKTTKEFNNLKEAFNWFNRFNSDDYEEISLYENNKLIAKKALVY
jgi:hypothetical protein